MTPPRLLARRNIARSVLLALLAIGMIAGNLMSAYAAPLTDSSLELSDPRTSQTNVTYTFSAASFTASAAQCMVLEFDSQADGAGGVPSAMDSTGAALDASGTLVTESNWVLDASTNGTLSMTYVTGETPAASGTLVFTGIDNGDTESTTYYALFTTYSDACTTEIDSVVIAFNFNDGELVSLTIDPTLTFTTNALGTGISVNGAANTTHASTATGIDYLSDVTSSQNGISAHRLDVTTNASGGYIIYVRHTGDLQNPQSDTITAHTGTNAAPSAFPAAGTEAWGYTTEDSNLSGGTADRFTNPGNLWAGFTTSNQPIVDNTAATAGTEQTNVGQQVGVAAITESGTYTTTIIYTIVATY